MFQVGVNSPISSWCETFCSVIVLRAEMFSCRDAFGNIYVAYDQIYCYQLCCSPTSYKSWKSLNINCYCSDIAVLQLCVCVTGLWETYILFMNLWLWDCKIYFAPLITGQKHSWRIWCYRFGIYSRIYEEHKHWRNCLWKVY